MSRKSLYELLEVNPKASQEAIEAAYERLSKKYDPDAPENRGRPDAMVKHQAVREAYATLSDAQRRRRYDQTHPAPGVIAVTPYVSARGAEASEGFSGLKGAVVLGAILSLCGGLYFYHERENRKADLERARVEAETKRAQVEAAERVQKAALESMDRRRNEYAEAAERARAEQEFRRFNQEVNRLERDRSRAEAEAARRAAADERLAEQRRMAKEREASYRARAEAAAAERALRQREFETRYRQPSVVVIPPR